MRRQVQVAFRIALILLVAVLGAACDSGDARSEKTQPPVPDLEFGEGVVPFTVPDDFPLLRSAEVGATMMDGVNGRTEMSVIFPASVPSVVEFYESALPGAGFDVSESQVSGSGWEIRFTRNDVDGHILLAFGGAELTSATIAFEH